MKQSWWTIPFFEASTPERLIAGITAGLTLWIDAGDCVCCFGGFGVYAGGFSGALLVALAGGARVEGLGGMLWKGVCRFGS